jgi:hypothetical protein
MISDLANISRMQGFSQAVMCSQKKPEWIQLGPRTLLWMKMPEEPDAKAPTFEFASPSPDIGSSLELLKSFIQLYLSSEKIDAKAIASIGEASSFSSGFERFLALIEKFEASADDLELFRTIEAEYFELVKLWINAYSDTTDGLVGDLKGASIPENAYVTSRFNKPQMIQSFDEKVDTNLKLLSGKVKSRLKVIKDIFEVEDAVAQEMLAEIDSESKELNGQTS